MSEKHIPRHRRSYAKELHTAIRVIEHLKQKGALYPSPNINNGELADVIGLGMGTVKAEHIPRPTVISDERRAELAALIESD